MRRLTHALMLAALALPAICSAENAAPARDIGAFIRVFLKNDHQVAISRESVRSAEVEERRSGDRADSDLTFTPAYTYSHDRGPGGAGSLDSRNLSNTLGYTHTAGYGTTFGASAGYDNDDSSLYSWQQDTYSSELTVSQPLLKNRFGRLWRTDTRSKGLARKSAELSHEDKALTRHLAAADIYTRAYTAQRKEAVFAELLANMRKVWEQTEKDYRKKLITKLNYLSVKSNWFEMLDTKERIDTEKRQRFHVLNLYTDRPWDGDLASPDGYFGANPVPEGPDLASHPSVRAAERKIDSLKTRARYLELGNAPDLDLDGSVGYAHTANHFSYHPRDRDAWTAKIGLSLALPVLDPGSRYDAQANDARLAAAQGERGEALRKLEERWKLRLREHRELAERLRLNEEKSGVYELQIAEAFRKFRQGRMEFQDYLQHWDLHQNAKLSALDLRQRLWSARLELLGAAGRPPALTAP